MRKLVLALVGGASLLTAMPAAAQYYYDDGYDRPPPRRQYRPAPQEWEYGRRPPPGYGYYPQRQAFGRVCFTSRGACGSRPAPVGSPCQCYIDGFGRKRGNIQ